MENELVERRKESRAELNNFIDTILESQSTELRTHMQRVETGIHQGHQVSATC